MALFDDVRRKQAAADNGGGAPAVPQMPQTFAQMQRGGYARPPQNTMPQTAYHALVGADPQQFINTIKGTNAPAPAAPAAPAGPAYPPWHFTQPNSGAGGNGPNIGPGMPGTYPGTGTTNPGNVGQWSPGNPTGNLNQGNYEDYLYRLITNPTETPTYQNTMN